MVWKPPFFSRRRRTDGGRRSRGDRDPESNGPQQAAEGMGLAILSAALSGLVLFTITQPRLTDVSALLPIAQFMSMVGAAVFALHSFFSGGYLQNRIQKRLGLPKLRAQQRAVDREVAQLRGEVQCLEAAVMALAYAHEQTQNEDDEDGPVDFSGFVDVFDNVRTRDMDPFLSGYHSLQERYRHHSVEYPDWFDAHDRNRYRDEDE